MNIFLNLVLFNESHHSIELSNMNFQIFWKTRINFFYLIIILQLLHLLNPHHYFDQIQSQLQRLHNKNFVLVHCLL